MAVKPNELGRISLFEQVAYLPLLHKLVVVWGGVRRFTTFNVACRVLHGSPLPIPPRLSMNLDGKAPSPQPSPAEREREKGRPREAHAAKFIGSMRENLFRGNLSPLARGEGTKKVCFS